MIEKFQTILKDIQLLEKSLGKKMDFYKSQGNVYLLADNKFKSQELLDNYLNLLKTNVSHKDLEAFQNIIKPYEANLKLLIREMDKDPKQELQELEETNNSSSTNAILHRFAQIKQITQRLYTEFYAYFIDSYSLKVIPPASFQGIIEDNLDDFNFSPLEEIDLLVDLDNLKRAGKPDINKLKTEENKSQKFKIQISTNTEVLRIMDFIEFELADDPIISEIVSDSLEKAYSQTYKFLYENLLTLKRPFEKVSSDLQKKIPNFHDFLIKNLKEVGKIWLTTQDKQQHQRIKSGINQIAQAIKQIEPKELFDFSYPRIYLGNFRQANTFEKDTYNAFTSLDLYSLPEFTKDQVLLTTLALVYSPVVYRSASFLICGYDHNRTFRNDVLNKACTTTTEKILYDNRNKLFDEEEEIAEDLELMYELMMK